MRAEGRGIHARICDTDENRSGARRAVTSPWSVGPQEWTGSRGAVGERPREFGRYCNDLVALKRATMPYEIAVSHLGAFSLL